MDQPKATEMLARLQVLVGEWTVEATPPGGPPWPGGGRTTFAWHESGAHLVVRSTVEVEGAPDSVSIIGCDAAQGRYQQLYSDDRGVCRIYAMTLDADTWTLEREGEPFPQRFTGRITDGGTVIRGRWELAEDGGAWRPDFDLVYRRV